jgi:hypothetical protein
MGMNQIITQSRLKVAMEMEVEVGRTVEVEK